MGDARRALTRIVVATSASVRGGQRVHIRGTWAPKGIAKGTAPNRRLRPRGSRWLRSSDDELNGAEHTRSSLCLRILLPTPSSEPDPPPRLHRPRQLIPSERRTHSRLRPPLSTSMALTSRHVLHQLPCPLPAPSRRPDPLPPKRQAGHPPLKKPPSPSSSPRQHE